MIVELGAGENPREESTHTVDIRTDLTHIDYGGVDIGTDTLPFDDEEANMVLIYHTLEHIPPQNITHVFEEVNRILEPCGEFFVEIPHSGTWGARTDLSHFGSGGTTPSVSGYFDGTLEGYWDYLPWDVEARGIVETPTFLRPKLRLRGAFTSGYITSQLVDIPFVTAKVQMRCIKDGK